MHVDPVSVVTRGGHEVTHVLSIKFSFKLEKQEVHVLAEFKQV